MLGKKYRLPVVKSTLDYLHSMYYLIEEIYLPEVGIAFNEEGYVLEIPSEDKRYKGLKLLTGKVIPSEYLGQVEVKDEDVEVLKKFVELKKQVEEVVRKYFPKKQQ